MSRHTLQRILEIEDWESKKPQEIAKILEMPVPKVKRVIKHLLKKSQENL